MVFDGLNRGKKRGGGAQNRGEGAQAKLNLVEGKNNFFKLVRLIFSVLGCDRWVKIGICFVQVVLS